VIAIVLVHPEIPPNTGNVIRLAANTGAALHLVEPLGFTLGDRELKRAGLDYHEYARLDVHPSYAAAREAIDRPRPRRWLAFTTRATRTLAQVAFRDDDVLVFGSETAGLPEDLLATFPDDARVRIPMVAGRRSLNLSNAVAVAVYEAWRQGGYAPMRQAD